MSHRLHDHGGVYNAFGKEMTHGHHIELLRELLGENLALLIAEYNDAKSDALLLQHVEDHPAHKRVKETADRLTDASYARLSGLWAIDRYDAPIEWYAEKIVGHPVQSIHEVPAAVQVQADAAMKRDKRPQRTEFADTFENLFTTQGVSTLWNQSANGGAANSGGSVPAVTAWFNNAQATIGVGASSTAATAAQYDLQDGTNRYWVGMDTSYPTLPGTGSNAIVFRGTFGSAAANFTWGEFAIANDNGSNFAIPGSAARSISNGTMLDRVVSAQGVKASGQTWQPSMTLSIS